MKPIIKADDVPAIFKRRLPTTTELRSETDTTETSQNTQDKDKSPKN